MKEFINLEQGDMIVAEYEKKFKSLSYFVDDMHLLDYAKASMFENKFHPRYENFVSS